MFRLKNLARKGLSTCGSTVYADNTIQQFYQYADSLVSLTAI